MSKKIKIDDYILQNYRSKTNAEMAKDLGCSKSTISNHRKKLGISATDLNFALRKKENYICSQINKKTSSALAKELNCSKSFIIKIWRENDLKRSNNKFKLNDTYFSIIDTPQKAYWLGFISADGCIYRGADRTAMLSISLNKKDEEILFRIREVLDTDKPIYYDKNNMATLQISSDKLCDDLLKIGIGVRKTFDFSPTLIFNNIPSKFFPSFLLGYFDGDGSISIPENTISKSKVSISGPLQSLTEFQLILEKYFLKTKIIQDKRFYTRPFGSLENINTTDKYLFLKFIYSQEVKSLKRKKDKAEELIKRIEQNITNRSENIEAIKKYDSVVFKWGELLES